MARENNREYHRFGDDLWLAQELKYAPEAARRIRLALGDTPLEDARHLLAPVTLPPPFPPLPPGPLATTEFIIDLVGDTAVPLTTVQQLFHPTQRAGLGFVHIWVQATTPPKRWTPLTFDQTDGRIGAIALSWELAALLTEGVEAIAELAGYGLRTQERAERLLRVAVPQETPEAAAQRSARLTDLKLRFSKTVEMRLQPMGRSFPARAVWRAAYVLGLRWGDLDLFHWHEEKTGTPLFSMNAIGHPGYFLPERAAEGEGTPGVALSFELPRCPAPVETYDRMGLALAYLRQHLGGRPQTRDGAELDADRLYDERDALVEAVQEMSDLGIAPGSPAAARFF